MSKFFTKKAEMYLMSPRRVHGAFCTGLTWAVKLTMPPLGSICRIMPTAIKTTSTFQRFQHTDSE